MENQISVSLTDAQWQEAETAVQTLKKLFEGQLVTLTPKQRQAITKMGSGSLSFTEKAADYARSNPELLPPHVPVEEFEIDLKAARKLNVLFQALSQFVAQLDDSMLLSGSEAFTAARTYYAAAKVAAKTNSAGAKVIASDLAVRFARSAKPDDQNPEPQA
jgi:hypothetical protein